MLLGCSFFQADAVLEIIAESKEVFQHAFTQAEFEMAAIEDWRLWRKDLDLRWK